MSKQTSEKPMVNFEQGIERLEQIVKKLDQSNVPLDQALDLFGEGIELVKQCNILLDSAEAKVKVLLEESKDRLTLEKLISGDK